MRATFEKLATDRASVIAFARDDPFFPLHWHFHPEYELLLVLSGRGQRLVGNDVADYAPGDLVLLGPNLPHSWRSYQSSTDETSQRLIIIQFSEDFAGKDWLCLDAFRSVRSLLARSTSGASFGGTRTGAALREQLTQFPALSLARQIVALLTILLDLASEPNCEILCTQPKLPMCRMEDQQRVEAVCSYLHQHSDKEIDHAAVSRMVHMNQASLCRFFKRATGRSMTTYVNELRVSAASRLLMETEWSSTEIAFEVGFGNYSNFHRQFKAIRGIGPRELRQQLVS